MNIMNSDFFPKLLLKILYPSENVQLFFAQVDCPNGQLSKDKIMEMYTMILPVENAKLFVDQIFRIFDKDGNGSIDFKVCKSCLVKGFSSSQNAEYTE